MGVVTVLIEVQIYTRLLTTMNGVSHKGCTSNAVDTIFISTLSRNNISPGKHPWS